MLGGALLIGIGDRLDPKHTMRAEVGDTGPAPAGAHHYTITYVHPWQAPRRPAFPYLSP